MKIILDAMGGDNAPDANIKGAVNAINKVKAEVILVGKEEVIRNRVKEIYGKELEAKVEEYKQKKESNNETSELVMEELEEANMKLGKTNIEGQGIEITIKPSQSEEIAAITADDLINIVNSLKSAGAEAISINDERILTMTDIVDINELFIKVNGQRILSPYVIKAVGNKSYLESALIGAGGVADNLKKLGHEVTIIQSDKVLVKKYDGDITYKYIND